MKNWSCFTTGNFIYSGLAVTTMLPKNKPMITLDEARQMAMQLPGTEEKDHFGIPSFRVNDRIFSTLLIHDNKMMVKLSLVDQSVFSSFDSSVVYPVPNKYGPQGYTLFELATVPAEMLEDALRTGWETIKAKTKSRKK